MTKHNHDYMKKASVNEAYSAFVNVFLSILFVPVTFRYRNS